MTLVDLLTRYSAHRIQFSARSETEYRTTLRNFERWLARPATLDDLTDDNLAAYLKSRVQSRSAATAKKDRQQLLTLWRWAWRKRLTETQPRDIPEVPVPRKLVRAWHPEEVAAILAACRRAPTVDGWGPHEWRALILVSYDSAERIDALLRCPLAAFDPIARTLTIPAAVRKRGSADQLASLHAETVEAINATLGTPRQLLFAFPGCYQTLLRRYKKLLLAASIDLRGRKVFHDLRRTSFTLTVAAFDKATAQRQCGHSQDLSAYYLDAALLASLSPSLRVADAIVRPAARVG